MNSKRWYATPTLSKRRAGCLAFIALVLVGTYTYFSPFKNSIERPFAFSVRSWLKKDPPLSSQIKIYGFDDGTLKSVGRDDLTLKEWLSVFKTFEKAKPRVVIIDKIFGTPRDLEFAPQFVEGVKALPFPVIAGAFVSPHSIVNRTPVARKYPFPKESAIPLQKGFVYGPHPDIEAAFSGVGHLVYRGDFTVDPYVRFEEDQAVPHASLFATNEIGEAARTPKLMNLANPTDYYSKTYSLNNAVKRAKEGRPDETLPKDAVIVILPALYTGGGDIAHTPFGPVPGGYVITAMVNSVLTHQWIRSFPYDFLFVGAVAVLSIWAALGLSPAAFLFSTLSGALFIVSYGLLAFSYAAIELPWLAGTLAVLVPGALVFFERMRKSHHRSEQLVQSLEGALPPAKLDALLKTPEKLKLEPAGKHLTIAFVDIVGFSIATESQTAEEAFSFLRKLIVRIADTVHEFGGVVDKTLGDGVLCFFGYDFDGTTTQENHAEQALKFAIKLQIENAKLQIAAAKAGEPVYPLRVGINTAEVFIGDLGNAKMIDLTVIGPGVNFAKRLETACQTNRIMIGRGTYEHLLLSQSTMKSTIDSLNLRYIQIKHHQEFLEAYEYHPLVADPKLEQASLEAYKQFSKAFRKDDRWPVPLDQLIELRTFDCKGRLRDFSRSGFLIEFDRYFAVGASLPVEINLPESQELRSKGLLPLICEIKWGRQIGENRYLHGVSFQGLRLDLRQSLVEAIRRSLKAHLEDKVG